LVLYTTAQKAARISAATVTAVEYLLVASAATVITQNTLTGKLRRNASGSVVSTTPTAASDTTASRCAAGPGRTLGRCRPGNSGVGSALTACGVGR
jgi:hypothetical protein